MGILKCEGRFSVYVAGHSHGTLSTISRECGHAHSEPRRELLRKVEVLRYERALSPGTGDDPGDDPSSHVSLQPISARARCCATILE